MLRAQHGLTKEALADLVDIGRPISASLSGSDPRASAAAVHWPDDRQPERGLGHALHPV